MSTLNELKEEARLRREISNNLSSYLKTLEDIKDIQNASLILNKKIEEYEKKSLTLTGKSKKENEKIIEDLKKELSLLEKQDEQLKKILGSVNAQKMAWASIAGRGVVDTAKGIDKIRGSVERLYGELKGSGLFEMDKEIKKSALSMGILSKGSGGFRNNILKTAITTSKLGIGVKELSELQTRYSDEIGRANILSEAGLNSMAQMVAATGLGNDGVAKMTAEFEMQGISAEKTAGYIEDSMNSASKMGINAQKTVKNIQGNIKMLNRYRFLNGVNGLKEMALLSAKLGINMETASGFADKMWNIEGAVDMAAQLNVMGGAWAQMADPFQLMYKARNDIKGLTEDIANAAKQSVFFNKATGNFDMSANEMHRLKIIAEQTGLSYDELVTSAKNAAKFDALKMEVSLGSSKEDKELLEYITNKAKFDKGKSTININGDPKLLKTLSKQDKDLLRAQMKQQQSLQERAEDARSFDEVINNLFMKFKISLFPFIQTLSDKLIPKLDELGNKFKDKKWGEKIGEFATTAGKFVSAISGFVIENPKLTAGLLLFAKVAPVVVSGLKLFDTLMDAAKWYSNGVKLGLGFNSVASAGGGVTGGWGKGKPGSTMASGRKMVGTYGKTGSKAVKGISKVGKVGGALSLAGLGMDAYSNFSDDDLGSGNALLKTLDQNKYMAMGAAIGSIIPGLGTLAGAGIGGLIDYLSQTGDKKDAGLWGNYTQSINDGLIPGNGNNRGIINNGKITPIDNKDDLLALKPYGVVHNNMKSEQPSHVKHTFEELKISGELRLTTTNGYGVSVDLMQDPQFKRDVARHIQSELEKFRNGGKNKG